MSSTVIGIDTKPISISYSYIRYQFDMMDKDGYETLHFYIRYLRKFRPDQLEQVYRWFAIKTKKQLYDIGLLMVYNSISTNMHNRSKYKVMDCTIIRQALHIKQSPTYHIYQDSEYPDIIF